MGGGLVLDANGNRFANELGRRDYVTGEMWKNKPPFRLCLNKAASDEISWHCKHSLTPTTNIMRLPKKPKRTQMVVPILHTLQASPGMKQVARQAQERNFTTTLS